MTPEDPGPSLEAGRQLILARRPELAERELRHFLAAFPESVEGHALLGWCLVMRGRRADAVAEAREAVRLGPDWPYAHASLAEVYLAVGRPSAAERSIRTALSLQADNAGSQAVLAAALLNQFWRMGTREALRATETGLALDPGHAGCARLRAQALSRLRRHADAREAAAYALRLAPELSETQAAAGWIYVAAGDRATGRDRLREALRLNPANADALKGLRLVTAGARAAAALLVQAERWRWPLRGTALIVIAELAALLPGAPPRQALHVVLYALALMALPGAAMLWAHHRHRWLVDELRLAPRDAVEAREARRMLALLMLLLLSAPWIALPH